MKKERVLDQVGDTHCTHILNVGDVDIVPLSLLYNDIAKKK